MPTIYNTTDGPLTVDRAGRQLGARERDDVARVADGSPLAGHIDAGRILVLEEKPAEEKPAKAGRKTSTTNEEA